MTDYPAAHKGQARSLPVEIAQSAGGLTAGVDVPILVWPNCTAQTTGKKLNQTERKQLFSLMTVPEIHV